MIDPLDSPHFDYPMRRVVGGHLAVNEQGDEDDVIAKVQALVRTPLAFRDELPNFGISDPLFKEKVDGEDIRQACELWVPDADFIINATDDEIDAFIKRVVLNVKTRGDS